MFPPCVNRLKIKLGRMLSLTVGFILKCIMVFDIIEQRPTKWATDLDCSVFQYGKSRVVCSRSLSGEDRDSRASNTGTILKCIRLTSNVGSC